MVTIRYTLIRIFRSRIGIIPTSLKHSRAHKQRGVKLKETDMRKGIVTVLAAAGLAIASGTAAARVDVGIHFGIPAPVYVQPAPVYYPRPVYVAPPVYYAPAPVYYSEPVYYYGRPHRRHHGHRHWR